MMKVAKPTIVTIAVLCIMYGCGLFKHAQKAGVLPVESHTTTNNTETVKLQPIKQKTVEIKTDTGIKASPVYMFIQDTTLKAIVKRMDRKLDSAGVERRDYIIYQKKINDLLYETLTENQRLKEKVIPKLQSQAKISVEDKSKSAVFEKTSVALVVIMAIMCASMFGYWFYVHRDMTKKVDMLLKRIHE